MAETPRKKVWIRLHANGVLATVVRSPEVEQYSYGAAVPGTIYYPNQTTDFQRAMDGADRASTCPQPCYCAPWTE